MGQGGLKMKEGALPLILLLEVNTEVVMRISGIAGPAVCHGHVVMDVLVGDLFRIQPAVDFEGGCEITRGLIGFGQVNQGDFVAFIQGQNLPQQLDGINRFMATAETLAHARYLERRGRLDRVADEAGRDRYLRHA